jgi:hypothetical protein
VGFHQEQCIASHCTATHRSAGQSTASHGIASQLKAKRPGLHGVQGGGLFHQEQGNASQRNASQRKALQRTALQCSAKQSVLGFTESRAVGFSTRRMASQRIA